MSTLLGFDATLVPPGTSLATFMSTLESALTSRGWQVVGRHLPWVTCSVTSNGTAITAAQAKGFFDGAESLFNVDPISQQPPSMYNTGIPTIATVALATSESVTSYEVTGGNVSVASGAFKDWTLQSSPDGVTWTTVDTQTNVPNMQLNERRLFTVSGTPTARPYWRLNITGTWTGSWPISKIRLYTANGMISDRIAIIVRPPSSETVGNTNREECVMFLADSTTLYVRPIVRNKTMSPKIYGFKNISSANIVCGIGACGPNNTTSFSITGSVSAAGVLTVTATAGAIYPGMVITGGGIPAGSYVFQQLTGTTGSTGTYNLFCGHAYNGVTAQAFATNVIASTTLTVSGSVVSITGVSVSSTSQENLRALYTAIKNSTDPNFTDYDWYYSKPTPQNSNDANDWIYAIQKTPGVSTSSTLNTINANVGAYVIAYPQGAGFQAMDWSVYGMQIPNVTNGYSMTLDLTNGTVYYLQINSRGGAIATKTNASWFGPMHWCYGDHTKALASVPTPVINSKLVGVSELVIGIDSASTSLTGYFWPGKPFVMSNFTQVQPMSYPTSYTGNNTLFSSYVSSTGMMRDVFVDGALIWSSYGGGTTWSGTGYNSYNLATASGVFLSGGDAIGDDFQIHRMVINGNVQNPGGNQTAVTPQLDIQDWYKFRGTASNEALALVPETGIATTLNQVMDSSTAYTTLTLTDASTFAASGFVVIESEIIQYTGISGNTLTGVTRAKFGSSMVAHWSGDSVFQGQWFTIINGGALYCGYTKPA